MDPPRTWRRRIPLGNECTTLDAGWVPRCPLVSSCRGGIHSHSLERGSYRSAEEDGLCANSASRDGWGGVADTGIRFFSFTDVLPHTSLLSLSLSASPLLFFGRDTKGAVLSTSGLTAKSWSPLLRRKDKDLHKRQEMLANMKSKANQMASTLNMSNFGNRSGFTQ
ncbi:hypothetical protein BHE74_00045041 [Ensete ventricosum]|nr:hypothetical protein GW17_00041806 [Ensete ventricosum]RWW48848.1 hypothetical protein BHE74_00045041 [Ensete ventricosum]RZR99909.1 hypothetical protein BHM03_00029548 [Ensete ventricosum]